MTTRRIAASLLAFAAVMAFALPAYATRGPDDPILWILGGMVVLFFLVTAGSAAIVHYLLRLIAQRRGGPADPRQGGYRYWLTYLGCLVGAAAALAVAFQRGGFSWMQAGFLGVVFGLPGGVVGFFAGRRDRGLRQIVPVFAGLLAAAIVVGWVAHVLPMRHEVRRFEGSAGLEPGDFSAVAVHPEGKWIASITTDHGTPGGSNGVYVWDLESGDQIARLESDEHYGIGTAWVGFSADGTTLLAIGDQGITAEGARGGRIGHATAWSVGGWAPRFFPAYETAKGAIDAASDIELETGRAPARSVPPGWPSPGPYATPVLVGAAALSADDLRAVYEHRGTFIVLDLVRQTVLHRLSRPDPGAGPDAPDIGGIRAALSADGNVLVAAGWGSDERARLVVWHLPSVASTGPRTFDLGVGNVEVGPVAASADGGRVIVVAGSDMHVVDVGTGAVRIAVPGVYSTWAVLSADGALGVADHPSCDGTYPCAQVFRLDNGELVAELKRGPHGHAAFTPDATRLVTGCLGASGQPLVVVWDVALDS